MIEVVEYRNQPGGHTVYTLWPFQLTLTWRSNSEKYLTYVFPVFLLLDIVLMWSLFA